MSITLLQSGLGEHDGPTRTKIVATLGPASDSDEMVEKLILAGVSIFRLNFSHGEFSEHAERLERVRRVARATGETIAVMGDLQGPKIRVRTVPDIDEGGGIVVKVGQDVLFHKDQDIAQMDGPGGVPVFGSTFMPLFHDVEIGQRVLINDGAIRMLAVDREEGVSLRCRVLVGGRITSKKGINLPESETKASPITERDWVCVEWAVEHALDYLALSFVQSPHEVQLLQDRLAGMCPVDQAVSNDGIGMQIPVVSKIERPLAVKNLDAIMRVTDAVMVARGDLGVEMDVAEVPIIQKMILAKAAEHGKPCIVATQMLETMIESSIPTRAEASDVANAVFDHTDGVMLSGETAVGKHPDLVVETMRRIVRAAEARQAEMGWTPTHTPKLEELPYRSAALAMGTAKIAKELPAKAVVCWSEVGGMARYLSQMGFSVPILAYTTSKIAARRMTMLGGVTPVLSDPPPSGKLADWTDMVESHLLAHGWAGSDDAIILIAGKPLGARIAQNVLGILYVGDTASGFRHHDQTAVHPASL